MLSLHLLVRIIEVHLWDRTALRLCVSATTHSRAVQLLAFTEALPLKIRRQRF